MRRGLTLGKFAPFHRGHQLMVETALAEVDELVVMIYDTDVTDVPLPVRAGWIRRLYPAVRVIEAWHGPDSYGDTPEIKREQEDYILKELDGLTITHFDSSEFYGDHVSRALGARHIERKPDALHQSGLEKSCQRNRTEFSIWQAVVRNQLQAGTGCGAVAARQKTLYQLR